MAPETTRPQPEPANTEGRYLDPSAAKLRELAAIAEANAPAKSLNPTASSRSRLGSAAIVWATVAVMTMYQFTQILRHGRNIPLAEDWSVVEALTGRESDFWSWVWSQNNEDRIPLARLGHLGLFKMTGDLRTASILSVALVAVLSAVLILVARGLRGHTSVVDAFFPIVLLHPGHVENLLWSWQLQFVIATVITGTVIALIASGSVPHAFLPTSAVVALLVLLTLGVSPALPVALCGCFAVGVLVAGERERRRSYGLVAVAGLAILALLVAYAYHWVRPFWSPDLSAPDILARSAEALAYGWGPAVSNFKVVAFVGTLFLVIWTVAMLHQAAREGADQRRRAGAFLALLTGNVLSAVAIGMGRGDLSGETFPTRYALLMTPLLLTIWFAWQTMGDARRRAVAHVGLLVAVLAILPFNVSRGYEWRDWYTTGMEAVERDIERGADSDALARRNAPFLTPTSVELLQWRIELLRKAGIGPFQEIEPLVSRGR